MSTGPGNPNPSNPSIHPAFASIHDELVDHVESQLASSPVMQGVQPLVMGGPSEGGRTVGGGGRPFGVGLPSGLSIDPSGAVRFAEDFIVQYLGGFAEQYVRNNAAVVKKWVADSVLSLVSRLVTDVEGHPTVMQARQDAAERGGEE
jgi:hypothetical protein